VDWISKIASAITDGSCREKNPLGVVDSSSTRDETASQPTSCVSVFTLSGMVKSIAHLKVFCRSKISLCLARTFSRNKEILTLGFVENF